MITEEALPSYAVALNLLADDSTGVSDRPWRDGCAGGGGGGEPAR